MPKSLDRVAGYAWRLIVIGVVAIAALWLVREARIVFFPIVIAVFLVRALSPVSGFLQRHRWRPDLAALASMLLFFVVIGSLVTVAVRSMAGEVDSIRPTIVEAVDDIEDWLVDDSPFDISRSTVDDLRQRAAVAFDDLTRSSGDSLADRATVVGEVLTGIFLALILTFFMLRDGRRFVQWFVHRWGRDTQPRVTSSLDAAWAALAGYLRGASLLGVLEAVVIGVTLWIAGAELIAPVVVITMLGAFVPIVGAAFAGVVAVLVALATAGTGPAIAVAVVVVIVQQLDNDLLAPIIYSRTLSLHPVAVLVSVVAGGALFGLAGTILAVPVVAVGWNMFTAFRTDGDPAHDPAQSGVAVSVDTYNVQADPPPV